ncbi:hypothetical protein MTO96_022921 [Rhipicephalus appendiculatus]
MRYLALSLTADRKRVPSTQPRACHGAQGGCQAVALRPKLLPRSAAREDAFPAPRQSPSLLRHRIWAMTVRDRILAAVFARSLLCVVNLRKLSRLG